jgi:PilZ domain
MLMVGRSGADEFDKFNAREYNRGDVAIMADIREMGGGKHKVNIVDLSRSGYRIHSLTYIKVDKIVFLTIPGFTPLEGHVAWHSGDYYGCQFTSQLHIAIYDHILSQFPTLVRS